MKNHNVLQSQNKKKLSIEKQNENNPKGFVSNDADLLSKKFVEQESASNVVSDAKYRDEKGCHYLGKMSVVCGHCSGLGFESEVQGHFIDSNGTKHSHFGELCCNKGKVKGILDYNLPQKLKHLYTSDDELSVHFRNNSRVYNNGLAMSSLTCNNKWQTRVYNNTCESMLTAQGQLLRRIGPILPTDDGKPLKCVQAYFVGDETATKWRMHHSVKRNISNAEKEKYKKVFNLLHGILKNDADNKYIRSFLGVKQYVEENLKGKVWDVKLSIHAEESAQDLKHKGRLNVPVVNEIAIVMPESDVLTKDHCR